MILELQLHECSSNAYYAVSLQPGAPERCLQESLHWQLLPWAWCLTNTPHHAEALHADQFSSQPSILCSRMPRETSHLLYTIASCGITDWRLGRLILPEVAHSEPSCSLYREHCVSQSMSLGCASRPSTIYAVCHNPFALHANLY